MKQHALTIILLLVAVAAGFVLFAADRSERNVLAATKGTDYTGRHGGAYEFDDSFSLHTSADGMQVTQITVSDLICGPHSHSFSVTLELGLPVTAAQFSATGIAVTTSPTQSHPHSLDIDGVFFDANGDGTAEQALGGLSFVSRLSRCHARWWATAVVPDADNDGWSDGAELRLGSSATTFLYTPEHREVPVTSRYGPGPCQDFVDSDNDGALDEAEQDGPDAGSAPDCMPPLLPAQTVPSGFAGGHGGAGEFDDSFSLHTSGDGTAVVQIDTSDIIYGQFDGNEADGPDPGAFPDCKAAVAFAYLPVVTRGAP